MPAQTPVALRVPPLRRGPDVPDLVQKLMSEEAYTAALTILKPQLHSGTADARALDQAATCYWQLDAPTQAMELMQQLAEGWPQLGTPCVKLAAWALGQGDRARAQAALDMAFARGINSPTAFALQHRTQPLARTGASARRIKALAEDTTLSARDRAIAQNTLGRIEDYAGRYSAAFRWFTAANRTWGDVYDPHSITTRISQTAPDIAAPDRKIPRMVFVTGMPRSGTTVLEHSLAQHPDIRPLGESTALARTVSAMRHARRLEPTDVAQYQQHFLKRLPVSAAEETRVLVSKMPLDCFDLTWAKILVPHATFIHLARHPLDVGLSNFVTLFDQGHGFARRLDWTAHMIRAVDQVLADQRHDLGPALHVQSYRALVENPKQQLERILDHIGLSWDPSCLAPQTGARAVRTASLGQIDQGYTTKGLGKWRQYEPQLGPLIAALGQGWITAWEEQDAQA